jgi:hypothetical protein
MPRWLSIIERDPILRRVLSLPVPLPPAALRAGVGRVYSTLAFADPDRIEPRVVRNFSRHFQSRERVVGLLENGRRLLPELRDPFELERIASRVLLVWGSEDRMVYPAGADKLLAAVADSRLELLEGCGHCPQLEEPERFSSMLFDFIGLHAGLRAA